MPLPFTVEASGCGAIIPFPFTGKASGYGDIIPSPSTARVGVIFILHCAPSRGMRASLRHQPVGIRCAYTPSLPDYL